MCFVCVAPVERSYQRERERERTPEPDDDELPDNGCVCVCVCHSALFVHLAVVCSLWVVV